MPLSRDKKHLGGDVLPQRSHHGRMLCIHLVNVHSQGFKDLLIMAIASRHNDGAQVTKAHAGEQDVAARARLETDGSVLLVG